MSVAPESTLTLPPGTSLRAIPSGGLMWGRNYPVVFIPWPEFGLIEHLDGTSPSAELLEDLCEACELDPAATNERVLNALGELVDLGLVLDPDQPRDPSVPSVVVDRRSTTVTNPDGTTTVTISTTLEAGATGATTGAYLETKRGLRSLAELMPGTSCSGTRLRPDDAADLLQLAWPDEPVTVRSTDPRASALLRSLGAMPARRHRGPTAAFVIAPLEGEGPSRVYDAYGARVGRARTTEEAVEHVFAAIDRTRPLTRPSLAFDVAAIRSGDRCVLVPTALLAMPRLTSALRARGADIVHSAIHHIGEGRVGVRTWRDATGHPTPRPQITPLRPAAVVASTTAMNVNGAAAGAFALLGDTVTEAIELRDRTLDVVATLLEQVPQVIVPEAALKGSAAAVADQIVSVLRGQERAV